MHLVHDNEVVEVSADLLPQPAGSEHVHRAEKMVEVRCDVWANLKIAEVWNAENQTKCSYGLFKNFAPMRDEQEAGLTILLL